MILRGSHLNLFLLYNPYNTYYFLIKLPESKSNHARFYSYGILLMWDQFKLYLTKPTNIINTMFFLKKFICGPYATFGKPPVQKTDLQGLVTSQIEKRP